VVEERGRARRLCPKCGRELMSFQLRDCPICRTQFCQQCGVRDFGRDFCSDRCRAMFFFGNGDEEPAGDE
jgi:hypothetical protein